MKPCEVYPLEVLADFAVGRLGDDQAEALRRHLDECPACRRVAKRLGHVQEALLRADALAGQDVQDSDHRALMARAADLAAHARADAPARPRVLRGFFRDRPLWKGLTAAAAAALIIAGAVLLEVSSRSQLGPKVAWTQAVRGTVYVGDKPARLKAEDALRSGHQLRTGAGARLSLSLAGGAHVELDERTSLQLGSFTGDRASCRVSEGRLYVALEPSDATAQLTVRTSVGRLETQGARFDLRVVPRSAASRWAPPAGLAVLAAAGTDILGNVGPRAELRLTVVQGEVVFTAGDDATPYRVAADAQLVYDPDAGPPQTRPVRAEHFTVWRMPEADLYRMAEPHLADLFAARQVAALPNHRVRLDYGFLTASEIQSDWRVLAGRWEHDREALRVRVSGDPGRRPGGTPAQIVSRAAFLGDTRVEFEVTVDPVRRSLVGWALRMADDGGDAPSEIAAHAEANPAGRNGLDIALDAGGGPRRTLAVGWPGPVFRFGGRIESGRAYVALQGADVLSGPVPDALQRRLYDAERPAPGNVLITAGGPDVFISNLSIVGRLDPDWLRAELARLLERPDARLP